MKEELTVKVELTDCYEVKSERNLARMLLFGGECVCENFKGKILPGGVDTQQIWGETPFSLSARYILEGVDKAGQSCRIFIENNGGITQGGEMLTTPKICTDSNILSYLETVDLQGTVDAWEKGVIIHIYSK